MSDIIFKHEKLCCGKNKINGRYKRQSTYGFRICGVKKKKQTDRISIVFSPRVCTGNMLIY